MTRSEPLDVPMSVRYLFFVSTHWLDHRSVAPDPAEIGLSGPSTFGQPHPGGGS